MSPKEMMDLSVYPDLQTADFMDDSFLSIGELKEVFRLEYLTLKLIFVQTLKSFFLVRLFDDLGEGYITVERFREILREIDDTISKEELDGIISEVSLRKSET